MTWYIVRKPSRTLVLLIFCITTTKCVDFNSSTIQDRCNYNGNICDIDYDKCLAQKFDKMKSCSDSDVKYGPGTIYETRKEINFNIKIVDGRESYAKSLTYRILLLNEDDIFESIDDCCSLNLNETCVLPAKRNHLQKQYVFIPLADETDQYCRYPIWESPGNVSWCRRHVEKSEEACKKFINGKLEIENTFAPLSTKRLTDYCFFEAPGEYIKANRSATTQRNDYTRKVIKIKKGEKDGEIIIENITHPCEVVKDVQQHFARHKRSATKAACVFTKSNLDNKWDTGPPTCTIPLLKDPISEGVIIVIVVSIATVLILIVLLSVWIYRTHVKTCFPDFDKTIKELPNTYILDNVEQQNFIHGKNTNVSNVEKEVPDLIIAINEDKKLDKSLTKALKSDELKLFTTDNSLTDENISAECATAESFERQDSGCQSDFKTSDQNSSMKHNFDDNEDCADLHDNSGDPDSGFSRNSFVRSSLSSTNNSDDTMTQCEPTFSDEVVIDGYTQKDNISSIDFAPKNKHSHVSRISASSSGRGSIDEEIFLKPGIKNVEYSSKYDGVASYIKKCSPLQEIEMTVDDGYTAK